MTTGRRAHLFREVNDRIYELLESAEPDMPGEFLCECGHDCRRRVVLAPQAFADLREAGRVVKSADCGPGLPGAGEALAGGVSAPG
jgi:hypothetical protein